MSAIRGTDIRVTLGDRRILKGVSVEAKGGEVVGLVGPNGAGKSTLMRALAGLVPAEGRIEIGDRPLGILSFNARARALAWLPQTRVIGWPVTVERAVALGRMPWGDEGHETSRAICRDAMYLADILHLAGRSANALSGGEQARVLAARAIAQDTPILLADEPVSGLDPAHQISLMAAFRRLAERGRAVMVSLHDLTLAARWCDRIVVMAGGAVEAEGSPEDVLDAGLAGRVFGISVRIDRDARGPIVTPLGLIDEARP